MANECERPDQFDGKSVAIVHEAAEARRNQVIEREMSMSIRDQFREMIDQRNAMIELIDEVFEIDIHYGEIVKGKGYVLLQAGAEFLGNACRLFPRYKTTIAPLENGHREVTVVCELCRLNGLIVGEAVGFCSTKESRHRRENVADAYHNVQCAAMKRAHTRVIRNTLGITDALKAMLARRAARAGAKTPGEQAQPEQSKKQTQPAAPPDPKKILEKIVGENHGKIEALMGREQTKKNVSNAMLAMLKGKNLAEAAQRAEGNLNGFLSALAEFIKTGVVENGAAKAEEKPPEAATGWGGAPIVERLPEESPFKTIENQPENLLPPEDPSDVKFAEL